MDIKIKKSHEKTLVITMIILVVIVILSLGLAHRLYSDNRDLTSYIVNNKQTIIKPMVSADKEYSFIGERGDARYLRLMALSFLSLRLDVNAQNIESSHEVLISYLSSELREKLIPVLSQEKTRVKVNNGNSTFFLRNIKVSPSNGIVDIEGDLSFFYGIKEIPLIPKHYRLKIETRNNQLLLTDFVEMEK
ncbi:hypothetical protein FHQ26_00610 [Testudinibacter sp. TR-2022]|uniref:TraE/TraK family type IV conjugative transfer system protein n=1 Tax=Testudinibacter sp. TR-2022 TaxID=2585029 RepID=UPI00111B036F|nr:TraE/TraK family type IV conjugative transfer system protein [Testudinibacter sp. TR-2022]TNH04039.1 hypothetical protein FHQ22_05830 [Pasteurellaceae bacterium Phil31]TNH10176.1 hypothetical protein FHQ25_06145 [Testudinibacter sp. TR-2022]TNH13036.1 hypothetical protein FHQ26_00610 [Testudinibacter sp. TR-2022]